jgi:hypothetical protein
VLAVGILPDRNPGIRGVGGSWRCRPVWLAAMHGEVVMLILVTAVIVSSLWLFGSGHFGLAACALSVSAFLVWWSGQPGPSLDEDLAWVPEERPKPRNRKH